MDKNVHDKCREGIIEAKTIQSPIFGNVSPKKLSGGVKTLILIYLIVATKETHYSYSKSNLAEFYIKEQNAKRIIKEIYKDDI